MDELLARAFAAAQAAVQQAGGVAGGLAGVGVRVLAVGDQAVGERGHARREVRVQVEHPEDRHVRGAGQLAQALKQFALHVVERLRDHGTVQDEVDGVDAGLQVRDGLLDEILPEALDHHVLDQGARLGAVVDRGPDVPAAFGGDVEHAAEGRGVALQRQQLGAAADAEVGQRGGAFEEGVGLVEEAGEKDAEGRLHGGV